jgi:polysaccharide biosynthesis transport protein
MKTENQAKVYTMRERGAPTEGSMELSDIYFILFRHKWKILLCSIAGLLAAGFFYLTQGRTYQSEAKLMVKYVQESKSVTPVKDSDQIQALDMGGLGILQSEVEILSSMDLALLAVDELHPERVLAKAGGGNDRIKAASLIMKNLTVEVPKQGKIIRIELQHPDPDLVQPILRQLIASYQKKHQEIHRPFGAMDNWLTRETDRLRSELTQTDEELRKWRVKLGVISLQETKKAYNDQMTRIQTEIFTTDADLQAQKAALAEVEKSSPTQSQNAATELGVPIQTLNQYKRFCALLNELNVKEQEMRLQYTESNSLLKQVIVQIGELEIAKVKMEEEYPKLLTLNLNSATLTTSTNTTASLAGGLYKTTALEARITALKEQLKTIRADADKLDEAESAITQLQRKKELDEANYRYFSERLEQARMDETLGASKLSNIPVVEEPTPPVRAKSKLKKILPILALSGVAAGIGLAFIIELFLDQSLKRPVELGKKLSMHLMLSIPDLYRNGKNKRRKLGTVRPMIEGEPAPSSSMEIAPWDAEHILRPYHQALRDRLMTYFEVRNMTHKPKLVAVTSCSKGAGVTSLATGLAAALSETGEGNVLLVDMGLDQGAAHPFHKGKPGCGLLDALESEKRDGALVQDKLYMVSAQSGAGLRDNHEMLPRVLPKKFSHLVPKMKASDYDFIIFDLPPVSQTSVTSSLSGFMDINLLVIEGEKTNREVVKQALSLLGESKATVSGVFNKGRTYVPGWLQQDL